MQNIKIAWNIGVIVSLETFLMIIKTCLQSIRKNKVKLQICPLQLHQIDKKMLLYSLELVSIKSIKVSCQVKIISFSFHFSKLLIT